MSQEIYPIGETYSGARATPELVGRRDVLEQIEKAIQDKGRSYIIYVTGEGGIGKTRLMKHVLEQWENDKSLRAASKLVDLYHTSTHTVEGLMKRIQQVLSQRKGDFRNYVKEREKLDEYTYRLSDEAETLHRQRERMVAEFLADFNRLSDEYRIILVLDTAEKLFFQEDPVARRLGQAEKLPVSALKSEESQQGEVQSSSLTTDIRNWLVESFLPNIDNVVVVLAGRPEPKVGQRELGSLTQALQQIPGKCFKDIKLQGLSEKEALAYFDAVIRSAEASNDPREAQAVDAVREWSEETKRTIFYSLHDDQKPPRIRPILLALAIDHLVIAGRPLLALTCSLDEARALSPEQRLENQRELKRALVQTLRENYRPADEIVLTLGWLRKGADRKLLEEITEQGEDEVRDAIDQITDLSFVKIRPADERIFLHDEMYDLLQKYGLDRDSEAVRKRMFEALRTYYEKEINKARVSIASRYSPLTETAPTALSDLAQEIADARERLQDALVEDLYYRLRWSASEGFQTYFRYAEEAIAANDKRLDAQLRAELLGFLGQKAEIDGLRRVDVEADDAVRRVKRLINDAQYAIALEEVGRLREEAWDLIEGGGGLAEAELSSWEALALAYGARASKDISRADELLTKAIENLGEVLRSVRWAGVVARAYTNRGYLYHHLQGRHQDAIEAYHQALPLWKSTMIEVEEANTLNLLADALAEVGDFHTARHLAWAGLKSRERLGPRSPVGESLLTLAYIEIRMKRLDVARRSAEQAKELFTTLGSHRGRGLALLRLSQIELSQVEQYLSDPEPDSTGRAIERLEKVVKYAEDAERIFDEKVDEPARRVEALIEKGLAYGAWAKLIRENPHLQTEEKEENGGIIPDEVFVRRSREALEDAAKHAKQVGLHKQVDAVLSLASLQHDTEPSKAEDRLDEIEAVILGGHRIEEYLAGASKRVPSVSSQVQLGRLELLRGQIEFNRYIQSKREQKSEEDLKEAVEHFTLALTCYTLFSNRTFRDMAQAMDLIHEHLRQLSVNELKTVYDIVGKSEEKHGLGKGNSPMSQFLQDHFGPEESLILFDL